MHRSLAAVKWNTTPRRRILQTCWRATRSTWPPVVIPAVVRAISALPETVRFLLHGDEKVIAAGLAKQPDAARRVEIRHAERVIGMDEKPAQALRRGKGTSMWNAVEAVRDGEAVAAVSAGNTGALMAISKLILRMSADLERPALVTSIPTTLTT